MSLWAVWLIIVVLLIIIEVMTVNLVTIWFIISGIVTMFVSFVIKDLVSQFAIFVLLGILLLILTKPIILEIKKSKEEKINLERIIGMSGICTEEIKKDKVGEVKVDGKLWSAVSSKRIRVNSKVVVERIDGVKLVVDKEVTSKVKKEKCKK